MVIMNNNKTGFTLIELAVVIVIIGLILGGIVVGQGMIQNGQMQAVVSDFDKYRSAAIKFRDKYKELPGDMVNAEAVWGANMEAAVRTCPPTASNNGSTTTCNGNGDTFIGDSVGNPFGVQAAYIETLTFWQHLKNAEMIKGNYNGRLSTAANGITPNVNVPSPGLRNAVFSVRYFPNNTVTTGFYDNTYSHVFFFGAAGADATTPAFNPILTPEEAQIIDAKIDDGKPGQGKVLAPNRTTLGNCATVGAADVAAYDITQQTATCSLIFITGF